MSQSPTNPGYAPSEEDELMETDDNSDLIEILEHLSVFASITDSEKHRVVAFNKAIESIKKFPFRIESGQEAKNLPGIGKGIGDRIEEIRQTGRLREHDLLMQRYPDLLPTLELFKMIHGVGPKTATKWYLMGYRNPRDVPREILTYAQAISIQFLNETNLRIPRADIQFFESELNRFLRAYEQYLSTTYNLVINFEFVICGSYRRGAPDSGDIDILVNTHNNIPGDVLNAFLQFPMFSHRLARGKKKFAGLALINGIHRRVDIELCLPHEYGPAMVYFTGSKNFNILVRNRAISMGLRLNEKSLITTTKVPIYVRDERHLFELLQIPYIEPVNRNY